MIVINRAFRKKAAKLSLSVAAIASSNYALADETSPAKSFIKGPSTEWPPFGRNEAVSPSERFSGTVQLSSSEGADYDQVTARSAPDPEGRSNPTAPNLYSDEIIVTARKREETSISVPVSIQAFDVASLEKYGTTDLVQIGNRVPGLLIHENSTQAGGGIYLRGVGSTVLNPSIEASVSTNIDGVGIPGGNIVRTSQIDMAQVEVFKGPQALFFGKNSPGGVISIRTADPGDEFEVLLKGSYEFYSRQYTAQTIFSGPITDTLGARLVLRYSDSDGYFKNKAAVMGVGAIGPSSSRAPHRKEYFTRGTILWTPDDRLSIRAKMTFNRVSGEATATISQRFSCPGGGIQGIGNLPIPPDDCSANRTIHTGDVLPEVLSASPYKLPRGLRGKQYLASLESVYRLDDGIDITSVTGYYDYKESSVANFSYSSYNLLSGFISLGRKNFSQELRLTTSNADWPINFTVGALFEDSKLSNITATTIDGVLFGIPGIEPTQILNTTLIPPNKYDVDGKVYSIYGQAIWTVTPQIELAGGVRWTHEKKRVTITDPAGAPITNPYPKNSDDNISPEATITYKPTSNHTIYAAYRKGFKSGGFNTAAGVSPLIDLRYGPEKAEGFEAGTKLRLGDLRLNVAAYRYKYGGLQVTALISNLSYSPGRCMMA